MVALGSAAGIVYGVGTSESAASDGSESGGGGGCGKTTKGPSSSGCGNSGYAVVDPMPPPAHCPGIAQTLAPTAAFEAGDAGALVLAMRLPLPKDRADFKYVDDAPAYVYGCKVVSHAVEAEGTTTRVTVDPGVTSVSVSVKTTCNQGPGTIMANVSWTGAPKPGDHPNVSLNEY
jgi:hypothetical protein